MANYDDVINLSIRRSLFYPSSEIYKGPAGFYNYGPYGSAIKRKIVDLWRKNLVQKEGFLEINGSIAMPEDVFKASGHMTNFNDPVTKCKKCGAFHRADHLLKEKTGEDFKEAMSNEVLTNALRKNKIACPKCKGDLSDVSKLNMMVKVDVGVTPKNVYLRPETCQTIFTDFSRMMKTMRLKLPQGVSQCGKSFRNEISPRQTILRTVEFDQMETEIFFDAEKINEIESWEEVKNYKVCVQLAGKDKVEQINCVDLVKKKIVSGQVIAYYLARTQQLYESYGFNKENIRFRQLDNEERAFYAKEAWDFEVKTSLGWLELIANNYRTDYDLANHANGSKENLNYVYPDGKKVLPHVWEISIGVDRTFYAVVENSLKILNDKTVLSLPTSLAPLHAAVFPLVTNKEEVVNKAKEVMQKLNYLDVVYDDSGSVGKRYARMDEVGVPYCITIDHQTVEDNTVTIRDRDTTEQKRVKIEEISKKMHDLLWMNKSFKEI
ncbi:glycine--tRNA ligase [archaeon]|nr:glycine--tRNA ligase [archaeon]